MGAEDQQLPTTGADSFETLLTAVATQLLGAPLESFDGCINDVLSRLVEFNGVERSTLSLVDPATAWCIRPTPLVLQAWRLFPSVPPQS